MNRFRKRNEMEFIFNLINNLPIGIRKFIDCDFITNYFPGFLGIYNYKNIIDKDDNRSYKDTSHCCFSKNVLDKKTIVVLYEEDVFDLDVIFHEIGHAIHEKIDFYDHNFIPLSDYAKTNFLENFATSFQGFMTLYTLEEYENFPTCERLFKEDEKTYHFFKKLFDYDPIKLYGRDCG
jgi:hypothetical protein